MKEDWEEPYFTYSGRNKALIWFVCITVPMLGLITLGGYMAKL